MYNLSLPIALACFNAAQGRPVEELLAYIHIQAWQSLDTTGREVIQALLLVPEEGGRLEQIAAAVEREPGETAACLQRLANLSLVNVSGDLREKRYALHQLTRIFVAQQPAEAM